MPTSRKVHRCKEAMERVVGNRARKSRLREHLGFRVAETEAALPAEIRLQPKQRETTKQVETVHDRITACLVFNRIGSKPAIEETSAKVLTLMALGVNRL